MKNTLNNTLLIALLLLALIVLSIGMYYQGLTQNNLSSEQERQEPLEVEKSIQEDFEPLPEVSIEPPPSHQLIQLEYPQHGEDGITSPLVITGQARGQWFFEATFPVVLTNWDGLIIAEGYAEAQDDWMTEDFVPFIAELKFEMPDYSNRGSLILQKANPSGLFENDDTLEITVFFK